MEWTNEMSLKLIDEYRKRNALWHIDNEHYRNSVLRPKLWQEIADEFDCGVHEIRKKLSSLLASFRHDCLKEARTESWKSKWFAFKPMSFLLLNKPMYVSASADSDPYSSKLNNSEFVDTESNESDNFTQMEEPATKDNELSSNTSTSKYQIPPSPPNHSLGSSSSSTKKLKLNNGSSVCRENNDSSTLFGEYVSSKLTSYSQYTQNVVQHKINNILFNADMGNFDKR